MSPLTFVTPDRTTIPTRNVLLYGAGGAGKSTGAASAPGPLLWVNAEGPGALEFARKMHGDEKFHEVPFLGSQTLIDVYHHLRDGNAPERTLVVDTVGEVYRILAEELQGAADRPSLQNYGDVNTRIDRFVRATRDLPVNVVLICHEELVKDETTGEVLREPVTGGRKLPRSLINQCDIVSYCGVKAATDEQPKRYMGQLVDQHGRHGKDRSGVLGDYRELNLTEWIETAATAPLPEEAPASEAVAPAEQKAAA